MFTLNFSSAPTLLIAKQCSTFSYVVVYVFIAYYAQTMRKKRWIANFINVEIITLDYFYKIGCDDVNWGLGIQYQFVLILFSKIEFFIINNWIEPPAGRTREKEIRKKKPKRKERIKWKHRNPSVKHILCSVLKTFHFSTYISFIVCMSVRVCVRSFICFNV